MGATAITTLAGVLLNGIHLPAGEDHGVLFLADRLALFCISGFDRLAHGFDRVRSKTFGVPVLPETTTFTQTGAV